MAGPPVQTKQLVTQPGGAHEFIFVDVELHGYVVPLLGLKKHLAANGYKQADIATLTAPFNSGRAIHASTVSNYLQGNVAMSTAMVETLESLVNPSDAASLANFKAGSPATPKAAAPASAPKLAPSFAKTLSSIPTDSATDAAFAAQQSHPISMATKTVSAPPPPPKLPEDEFPLGDAYKLASMVRQAAAGEQLTATFSLRKLGLWGQSFVLLRREGFSEGEAVAGGFHLAVLGKSVGEERQFLVNAFQQIFAREPKLPMVKPKRGAAAMHPMLPLIRPIVEACLPIWLVGPTGSGKTHAMRELAKLLGREFFRIQGTGDTNVDDLLGGFAASGGTTRFEYGPLPLAMKSGGILCFDEITVVPAEVLFELQAVLEGQPLVIKKNRGEVVYPQPGFCLAVGDNTVGLAEDPNMIGTKVMNEAFRDRWLFARFDYMPEDTEKLAATEMIASFAQRLRATEESQAEERVVAVDPAAPGGDETSEQLAA